MHCCSRERPAIGGQQHTISFVGASHWRSAAYDQFGQVEISPSVKLSNSKTVNNKTGCMSCVSLSPPLSLSIYIYIYIYRRRLSFGEKKERARPVPVLKEHIITTHI